MHKVNKETLRIQHEKQKVGKAVGVDKITKEEYAKKWLHEKMHEPIITTGETLKKKLIGHYAYYGVEGNYKCLVSFYEYIKYTWYEVLRKRSQKNKIKYSDYLRIWNYLKIPQPKISCNIW